MGILDNVVEGAGAGAATGTPWGAIIGAGAGLVGGLINNSENKAATQQQVQNQEKLGQYQQQLQEQTWRDTSYPAQRQEMEEAGLNPALMYSAGAGTGGTTGAGITTSVDRTPVTDFGQRIIGGAAAGQEADKQNAEETKTKGADTKNVEANTQKQEAEVPLIQAQTANTAVGTQLEQAKLAVDGDPQTVFWRKEEVGQEYQKLWSESHIAANEEEISSDTKEQKIAAQNLIVQQYNAGINNLIADTIQKGAQTQLTNAEARKVAAEIDQKWKDINLHQTAIGLEHGDRLKMMTTILEAAGINAAGNVANTVLGLQKGKLPTPTKVTKQYYNTDGTVSTSQINY